MSDRQQFWREVIVLVAMFLVVTSLLVGFANFMSQATCNSRATAMNLKHSWGPLQGCLVTYKGEIIPIEAIGVRTIELHK